MAASNSPASACATASVVRYWGFLDLVRRTASVADSTASLPSRRLTSEHVARIQARRSQAAEYIGSGPPIQTTSS